jgi:hypothetical protein
MDGSTKVREVQRLYAKYNPEKLADVNTLLSKYGEVKLLAMVMRKYAGQEAAAAETQIFDGFDAEPTRRPSRAPNPSAPSAIEEFAEAETLVAPDEWVAKRLCGRPPTPRALTTDAVLKTGALVPAALQERSFADGGSLRLSQSTYAANDPSEDRSTLAVGHDFVFAGVYDGHGGWAASEFAETAMFANLQAAMAVGAGAWPTPKSHHFPARASCAMLSLMVWAGRIAVVIRSEGWSRWALAPSSRRTTPMLRQTASTCSRRARR